MKYRRLDENKDMAFGHGSADYLVDNPQAVAQAVATRLRLWTGEWFLDHDEGAPHPEHGLGVKNRTLYDAMIRKRILETPGVRGLRVYTSELDPETRTMRIRAEADTDYGVARIAEEV